MKRFTDRLKRQAEENPLAAIMVGVAVATVTVKMIEAYNENSRTRTWEKEVERRRMNSIR